MNEAQTQAAEKILAALERQKFADWYNNRFDIFITAEFPKGHPKRVTKEMILADITRLFTIGDMGEIA